MHWYDGILEVSVHDEVGVGQPHLVVMMNGIQIFVV
jgi:hypothetical protein